MSFRAVLPWMVAALLCVACSLPAPEADSGPTGPELNYRRYDQVQSGMEFGDVVKLLGQNYEEASRVEIPGAPTTVVRIWRRRSGPGNCNVTFQDGRVVAKAQSGLK